MPFGKPRPGTGLYGKPGARAAWHRSKRLRSMWRGVEVHCSCGAHWFGWAAVGNAIIRDHYDQGHQLSDQAGDLDEVACAK